MLLTDDIKSGAAVVSTITSLNDIQGKAEVFTTRNGPALSIFEKMQLYYT